MPTARSSLDLLYAGSPREFVEALRAEALAHPAARPRLLRRLALGELPSTQEALRLYAHHYSFYSRDFTRYLTGVIEGLPEERHREELLENLREEEGTPGSTALEGRPHAELFALFKRGVGVTDSYAAARPPLPTALVWRAQFMALCSSPVLGVGLGAIGLGTELIVPSVYAHLLSALDRCPELPPEARVFFELHLSADDQHAEDLLRVTEEVALTSERREAIRFGAHAALHLRESFWAALEALIDAPSHPTAASERP